MCCLASHACMYMQRRRQVYQVATVMVATARIATAAQIDQSHSPGGVKWHPNRFIR